ncbi:MAG: bifunctional oligoribonuclease/PAP phosphatase NrnA [Prevotellaceae bacterium]|jgi:phosphoesterase RecJ-like protein|nr:bifunctional oligoribonuclease/PAP phosphatase NrnA [Prevotellaceae bacterium]
MLRNAKQCLVVSHVNPDGDAVGASLAWWSYLRAAYPELEARVAFPNRCPEFLGWIEGANQVMIYADNKEAAQSYLKGCDLVFCLDFNALNRLEGMCEALTGHSAPRVLIDHHRQPADEFALVFSDITMSSTSEFIYRIVLALGGKTLLSRGAAEALYVGLITDTGSFSFSVSTPEPFRMAADLMELGVDKDTIASRVYDSFSEKRMRLLGYCLNTKMRVFPKYKAAYVALSRSELDEFGFQVGDTEGFVNFPLSIKKVSLSALLMEASDKTYIRVSLRSKGNILSVNELARKYFNGGGHFNASGGKFFGSLKDCEAYFEKILKDEF